MKKLNFISWNWRKENSTVACGSSPIKIHHFDHTKRFINIINTVYLLPFVLRQSHLLLCWNGSVTSASRYVTSVSRYQSRSSMYMQGLIPWNSTELAMAVLVVSYM